MRFKVQQQQSSMPEINLVPLMDVVLAVLTFFILLSLTLTGEKMGMNIQLPKTNTGASELKTLEPLVVELTRQNQIFLGNQLLTSVQLEQQIQSYLAKQPTGTIFLKADSKLPYEQVVQLLNKMQKVGGSRVSLAISN